MKLRTTLAVAGALLAAAACNVESERAGDEPAAANQAANQTSGMPAPKQDASADPQSVARVQALAQQHGSEADRQGWRQQARTQMQDLRLVVDQSDRMVRLYRGDRLIREHEVAVGTEQNPTPIGDFAFHRVDLNPRWVPPESEWAQDRESQPPGDPDNPMGRARLVYMMPYTIHGTDDLDSLGKAVSHGSIRLANEHVIPVAEMLLKAGNAWQGDEWFRQMTQNRNEEYQIALEEDVPLKIQE